MSSSFSLLNRWKRMSRDQKTTWKYVGLGLLVGTAIKFGYFYASRSLIVTDTQRNHKEATAKLKESREFGEWSEKDREARLPTLTPEQERQMQEYLRFRNQNAVKQLEQGRVPPSNFDRME